MPRPAPPAEAVVGYIHGGTVRAEFMTSVLGVVVGGRTRVSDVLAYQSGPNISTARNLVTDKFLREHDEPWLLMADTDMWFAPDTLDRLITAADPVERPVVGALCFSQNADGLPYSTMYELTEPEPGRMAFARYKQWPEDECVRVSATGAGVLLVHRTAFEAVEKTSGDVAAPWFRETAIGAPLSLMGEDLTFMLRLAAADIPVHVHTGVRAGHMKTTMLI